MTPDELASLPGASALIEKAAQALSEQCRLKAGGECVKYARVALSALLSATDDVPCPECEGDGNDRVTGLRTDHDEPLICVFCDGSGATQRWALPPLLEALGMLEALGTVEDLDWSYSNRCRPPTT